MSAFISVLRTMESFCHGNRAKHTNHYLELTDCFLFGKRTKAIAKMANLCILLTINKHLLLIGQ